MSKSELVARIKALEAQLAAQRTAIPALQAGERSKRALMAAAKARAISEGIVVKV